MRRDAEFRGKTRKTGGNRHQPHEPAAVEEEWKKLRAINAWLEDTAREYDRVRAEAAQKAWKSTSFESLRYAA